MSEEFLGDFEDVAEIKTTGDVRFSSGSWVGTANAFILTLKSAIENMIGLGVVHTLEEYIPRVALKDGPMREALETMFIAQIQIQWGGTNVFRLQFDRDMVKDPIYLRYHDLDWEIRPQWANGRYFKPTTLGTAPFSEVTFISILYDKLLEQMITEFIKTGFSYTVKSLVNVSRV